MLVVHLDQVAERRKVISEDVFDVTMFFLEELLSIFESMDILMRRNDYPGSIKLARSILETSISLQYIYKEDTEKRARNFKLASLEKLSKRLRLLNEDTPETKQMIEFFEQQLKEYSPERNAYDKFKDVGSEDLYLRSYKRLSEHVHPTYRPQRLDYTESRPYIEELKRTVRADTLIITLMALEKVCLKYDLDGGMMTIDDLGYKGTVSFATNPRRAEEYMSKVS